MTRREFSPKQKAFIRERDNHTCALEGCDEPAHEVDHIVECWNGGSNETENGQLLCTAHHKLKSAEGQGHQAKRRKHTPQKERAVKRKAARRIKQTIPIRPFQKTKTNWPKGRKIQSRGF